MNKETSSTLLALRQTINDILVVCGEKQEYVKGESFYAYRDDKITIIRKDDSGSTSRYIYNIYIIAGKEFTDVCSFKYDYYCEQILEPDIYRPGKWLQYINNELTAKMKETERLLAEKQRQQEIINFSNIDDLNIFGGSEMKIRIIKGDITTVSADAIVNAANKALMPGGGVDGAITTAAGAFALNERMKIGGCNTGQAVIGPAGDLDAEFIIYTVGPKQWDNKPELLVDAYKNSIQLAIDNGCKSVAIPAISAGVYGFSGIESAECALEAVDTFTRQDIEIIFVLFVDDVYDAFMDVFEEE